MEKMSDRQRTMTLKVKKFRAINSAQIDLDGITVIAGENGSGKSTLSKILYNTIRYSKKYELLIGNELNTELRDIISALFNLVQEIARYGYDVEAKGRLAMKGFRRPYLKAGDMESLKDSERVLHSYLDAVRNYTMSLAGGDVTLSGAKSDNSSRRRMPSPASVERMGLTRVNRILQNALRESDDFSEDVDLAEVLDSIRTRISASFDKAYEYYNSRPIDLFSKELLTLFHQPVDKKFDLIEYGLPITDWSGNRFNNTNWIKHSIYVDTPMAINEEHRTMDRYWSELNGELKNDKTRYRESDYHDEISNVIAGEVYYDSENLFSDGFKYKRNDGSVFDIDDCATGIKAFGILQLLLNNGRLRKDTLLIVDEPEAHLHPQWIVEYARVMIFLNKRIGVKFFIASHNPDMVSAIKYISEKEGISDRVNFYLAEKRPDDFTYNYKALKNNIEEIFSSFNIAIERIDQYGVQDA